VLKIVRWVLSVVAIALAATIWAAPGEASPIFRLPIFGGLAGGTLESVSAEAIAPMAGGGFVLVDCRHVTRVGRNAVAETVRIRWAGARPHCRDVGLGVAALADDRGALLAAGEWGRRVVRITPAGRARIVAGRPVTRAPFISIGGMAALPDGGFLVSDPDDRRIRRVSAGGVVTTVAGTGGAGPRGDGGPAVEASLRTPMGLTVEADGSFLVADAADRRVRRVRPDGTIETIAGNGVSGPAVGGRRATETSLVAPRAVASLGNGTLLIADPKRVHRVGPAGRIITVAGDGGTEWGRPRDAGQDPWPGGNFFDGNGGPATRASIGPVAWIGIGGDGSYLIKSWPGDYHPGHVSVVPARRSAYFGVAFRRLRPRLGYVAYRVNRPARVRLQMQDEAGRSATRTVTTHARAGLTRMRLPAGARPGVYELELVASATGGYRSADHVGVVIGGRLPNGLARRAVDATLDWGDYENTSEVGSCKRMNRARVDCDIEDIDNFECESNVAVRLHAGGQLEFVRYPCGPRRRRVAWQDSERLPLLGL
jgi:hypothetical protein